MTADAMPDLSAGSATVTTFSTSVAAGIAQGVGPRFGQQVFLRKDGCCAINAPAALETHPAWAIDKTFTAPIAGWYHLAAEGVTHFQCNVVADKASWGDGVLLEVYRVSAGVTSRIWAALLGARSCDPAAISLSEFLQGGDRLVVRGATHSGDSRLDGLNLDPVVRLVQVGGAATAPPCAVHLSPTGDTTAREGAISSAIAQAAAMVGAGCPRAEVVLGAGTYLIGGPISFDGASAQVTLRGDASGTRALLAMTNRTAHLLELNGTSNEVRGITFDYATIGGVLQTPFTQGTITSVELNGDSTVNAVHLRLDPGFDDALDGDVWQSGPSVQGVVFSSAGAAKTYAWFDGAGRGFTKSAGTWRLPFAPTVTSVRAGDRVAITARGFGGTLNVNGRENRLTDVTVHAAAELAVRSSFATGLHARRFAVVPGPAVNGVPRLLSGNSDGLHLKNLRRGATVEECEFVGLADDGINSHADGQWLGDAGFAGNPNLSTDWFLVYRAATLAPGNGGLLVQPLSSPTAAGLTAFGDRTFNISASGEGTLVRNSKFHELRGSGIVLRGGLALISRNQFWNVFGGADAAGNNPFSRAVNLETGLAACASQASCGGNDEGPYAYYAYIRHNTFTAGNPAGGNTWYPGNLPVIRNQPGDEGCWPWNGSYPALCYPENQGPGAPNVTAPNP